MDSFDDVPSLENMYLSMLSTRDLVFVLHAMNHSHIDDGIQHQYNHLFSLSNNVQSDDRWKEEIWEVFHRDPESCCYCYYWSLSWL